MHRKNRIFDYLIDIWADGNAASTCGEIRASTTTTPAAAAKVQRNRFLKCHHKHVKGRAKCVKSEILNPLLIIAPIKISVQHHGEVMSVSVCCCADNNTIVSATTNQHYERLRFIMFSVLTHIQKLEPKHTHTPHCFFQFSHTLTVHALCLDEGDDDDMLRLGGFQTFVLSVTALIHSVLIK